MSREFKDIRGQKFGRLTALYRLHNYHKKTTHWLCVCECGNLKEIEKASLLRNMSKSCGCYRKETSKKQGKSNMKHGKIGTRLYTIWRDMKIRCTCKNSKDYKNYGGRGIVVCDEWLDNFQAFYDWSMNNGYDDSLTIDRIDVNGNYEPFNCRWATWKQQARNKRNNCFVKDCLNKTMSLKDVATKYNIPIDKIFDEYQSRRKMYNFTEIQNIMREVYYCED